MLYKADKTNLYFLGSIHALDTTDLPFKANIDHVYNTVSRVAFEADIGAAPDPLLTLLPEHLSLDKLISSELYSATLAVWNRLNLPLDLLEQSKPWHVAHIVLLMLLHENGFSIDKGIDKVIWERAVLDSKKICTLETAAEAYSYLDSVPPAEQEAYLSLVVKDPDNVMAEFHTIMAAYKSSDIETLHIMLRKRIELFPNIFSRLLNDRNKAWLDTFLSMAGDNTPTLVVIGGLHFVGPSGIPALMQKQGYSLSLI
jgi:hypothetical protein